MTNYQRPLPCWDNANFPGTSSSYNKSINQRDYSITNIVVAFKLAERDRRRTTIPHVAGPLGLSTFTRCYQQEPRAAEPAGCPASWSTEPTPAPPATLHKRQLARMTLKTQHIFLLFSPSLYLTRSMPFHLVTG